MIPQKKVHFLFYVYIFKIHVTSSVYRGGTAVCLWFLAVSFSVLFWFFFPLHTRLFTTGVVKVELNPENGIFSPQFLSLFQSISTVLKHTETLNE